MTTYEQQEPGDAVRPIKAGPFFASDAEAARSVADRWGKAVPAALTRADLDDALLGVAARLDRLDVRELNLAPERMLLREAVDRIAGCAGDPCCAACGDWAARVRLVLGTDDLGVEGAASGGGVGIEGARVIEAARRLADCSAFDVVDEMDGLRAALAALDAPPIHQERHQPPSGGDPASQGGGARLDALERRVEAVARLSDERLVALEEAQSSPEWASVRLGLEGVERRVGVLESARHDQHQCDWSELAEDVAAQSVRIALLEQARNGG